MACRVLIVEDDPDLREMMDQMLTLEGFEQLMQTLELVLGAVGRPLARPRQMLQAATA